MVIKCATYASVNPSLHNFEAQLNTFLCAEGLYCTQYGLITRAEGLGVGEGRGIVERGGGLGEGWGAPHNDIVLNITKYLKWYIVFPRTQLVGFPVRQR